jgi:hypothetical protein
MRVIADRLGGLPGRGSRQLAVFVSFLHFACLN